MNKLVKTKKAIIKKKVIIEYDNKMTLKHLKVIIKKKKFNTYDEKMRLYKLYIHLINNNIKITKPVNKNLKDMVINTIKTQKFTPYYHLNINILNNDVQTIIQFDRLFFKQQGYIPYIITRDMALNTSPSHRINHIISHFHIHRYGIPQYVHICTSDAINKITSVVYIIQFYDELKKYFDAGNYIKEYVGTYSSIDLKKQRDRFKPLVKNLISNMYFTEKEFVKEVFGILKKLNDNNKIHVRLDQIIGSTTIPSIELMNFITQFFTIKYDEKLFTKWSYKEIVNFYDNMKYDKENILLAIFKNISYDDSIQKYDDIAEYAKEQQSDLLNDKLKLLEIVSESGRPNFYDYLVAQGIKPNIKCLEFLCLKIDSDITRIIQALKYKLIINKTCLRNALFSRNKKIIKFVIENGIKLDIDIIEHCIKNNILFDINDSNIGWTREIYDLYAKYNKNSTKLKYHDSNTYLVKNFFHLPKIGIQLEFNDALTRCKLSTICKIGLKHKINPTQENFVSSLSSKFEDVRIFLLFRITGDNYNNELAREYGKFLADKPILYKLTKSITQMLYNNRNFNEIFWVCQYYENKLNIAKDDSDSSGKKIKT